MAYLVYCPTCNGQISVNAKKCIHCGESHFFEYKEYRNTKTIKNTCPECKGTKKDLKPSWKHSYTYFIHQLYDFDWGRVSQGDLDKADFNGTPPSDEEKRFFAECVSKGDYILKREDAHPRYIGTIREVSVGKYYWKCYKCNGLGYIVREEVDVTEEKIDIRKRVPTIREEVNKTKREIDVIDKTRVKINRITKEPIPVSVQEELNRLLNGPEDEMTERILNGPEDELFDAFWAAEPPEY